jgi:hypothetical protein
MVPPNMVTEDGRYFYQERHQQAPPAMPHGSPYGPPPSGLPGSARSGRVNSMEMGGGGEDANGRRVLSSSAESAEREHEGGGGRSAFTAVNQ